MHACDSQHNSFPQLNVLVANIWDCSATIHKYEIWKNKI